MDAGKTKPMLKHRADSFLRLGQNIQGAIIVFGALEEEAAYDKKPMRELDDDEKQDLKNCLTYMAAHCKRMNLRVSAKLLENSVENLPRTSRELQILIDTVLVELQEELFLFVPSHRAKYYDLTLQSTVTTAFPKASKEIVSAGNCFAAGFYTASVFHSMRAAEIGVRVLGDKLEVAFPDKPLELAEWQNILDQCDSKIVKMKELRRSTLKDAELNFYSQAAVQFRYFKDAWRVRVAHARENYDESTALRVFNHTMEFFDVLATRLKEPVTVEDLLS